MSLETEIKKLTAAIEANTAAIAEATEARKVAVSLAGQKIEFPELSTPAVAVAESAESSVAETAETSVAETAAAPESPKTEPAAAPAPPAQAAPMPDFSAAPAPTTAEELNAFLVEQYNRIGDQAGMLKAMQDISGSQKCPEIVQANPASIPELVAAIQAIPAKA